MDITSKVVARFADRVEVLEGLDYPAFRVSKEHVYELLYILKEDPDLKLNMLVDLTAVDYIDYMEAVYHVMNLQDREIVRVKVTLDKDHPTIPSIVNLFKGANMMERETYDMLGVIYEGHPDLRRILCSDDFEGHPLRKDFNMTLRG